VIAALISGWEGQISATALTALGCLAVGTALARLITPSWFVLGVLGMCLADVALLASGVGTSLGAAYGLLLLPVAHLLPATVPIALTLLMLESADARRAATRARTDALASALRSAG